FGFKFGMDSAQTYELAQALQDAYSIGSEKLGSGKRTVLRGIGKDEVLITEKNKLDALRQLSRILTDEDINKWIGENISALSTDLALARIYQERKLRLQSFKKALDTEQDE